MPQMNADEGGWVTSQQNDFIKIPPITFSTKEEDLQSSFSQFVRRV